MVGEGHSSKVLTFNQNGIRDSFEEVVPFDFLALLLTLVLVLVGFGPNKVPPHLVYDLRLSCVVPEINIVALIAQDQRTVAVGDVNDVFLVPTCVRNNVK